MIVLDSMGHLYSTDSIKELYDFSIKLGLKPYWNHYSRHFPHFDLITESKKKLAIKLGAKLVDARKDFDYVRMCRLWAEQMYNNEHLSNNIYYYKSKGLLGQEIYRIDFKKITHLL